MVSATRSGRVNVTGHASSSFSRDSPIAPTCFRSHCIESVCQGRESQGNLKTNMVSQMVRIAERNALRLCVGLEDVQHILIDSHRDLSPKGNIPVPKIKLSNNLLALQQTLNAVKKAKNSLESRSIK